MPDRFRDLHEVFTDPQIAARSMVVPMSHPTAGDIRVLGSPLKLSDTRPPQRTPRTTLGQLRKASCNAIWV
jgi:crotonobetainyl-CoA:carnitine CoA-transferase CaiB-like acyl-CoA transferase